MKFLPKATMPSLEKVYLTIALASGLIMAVLNPPFAGVPDEQPHFLKAWAIALGDIACEPGNTVPKSAYDLSYNYPKYVKVPGVGEKVVFHKTLQKLLDHDDMDDRTGNAYAVCAAPPLGYLPQALGLRLGSLLNLSALAGFYLARIFNLVATALLVFWAIRLIPFGKMVLLVIGLLPMTIQQAASLGYDALHIATSFLFIAFLLKLACASDEPLRAGEAALLLLLGVFVCNVKFGYVGMMALVFVLPVSKFRDRKRYWLFSLGFIALNLLVFYLVYRYFQAHLAPGGGPGLPKVHTGKQFNYVLGSPLHFLSALISSLYMKFNFYFETFVFKPGWLNVSLSPLWYALMVVGTVLLIRNQDEAVPLTMRQRYVLLGVFLLNLGAVYLSMYLAWTPVGARRIEGVQGRYLLSFFPLLILFFYKAGFTFSHEAVRRNIRACLLLFYAIMFGWAFLSLYGIYYDKEPDVPLIVKMAEKLTGHR
jgi:uncharacterized membrane protein